MTAAPRLATATTVANERTGTPMAADAVPLGAIPVGFLRNQLVFCSLICPSIAQLVTTVPLGAAQAPIAFVGALQSGSLLRASVRPRNR
jgi:hypothetical protein